MTGRLSLSWSRFPPTQEDSAGHIPYPPKGGMHDFAPDPQWRSCKLWNRESGSQPPIRTPRFSSPQRCATAPPTPSLRQMISVTV
ncbi:uncharacterized protein BDZ99DRAFT_469668 [Mytilinidion resinicola]|uniref:Uncharacterized protein n=1 Tax=Mytilinidion resinicola TaxID=574789 RepID=A0A6A6XY55_9PEZI|nr:uncharacterized protein BDZ99DRAFT_469668 [Mytilinidion resinicola]KAF2801486.1 hypothetical protein BDZ99DRAFT_469668 [Mytilinidion resinicola]